MGTLQTWLEAFLYWVFTVLVLWIVLYMVLRWLLNRMETNRYLDFEASGTKVGARVYTDVVDGETVSQYHVKGGGSYSYNARGYSRDFTIGLMALVVAVVLMIVVPLVF